MREIKFRGKRIDNGDWVYGCYSWSDEMPKRGDVGHFISCGLNAEFRVDPAAVGQFTGLKDKNGREIYEGDIVKTANGRVLEVSYNIPWTSFILTNKYKQCDCERLGNYCTELLFEVIGTIHDQESETE